jgi:phenylacetic acid degradation operon negative regulatory protein
VAEQALRPFNARSLVLSILLGLDPPTLPARSLVAVGELFGIAGGTVRTALSRMVAAGELTADGDGYRLVGRVLLERKAAQDIGRAPAPGDWDGTWWLAVVTAPRRSIGERRAFRTDMANLRMGELRPDTWMRPANLDGPSGIASLAIVRGELEGEDPVELAARLWPLDELARSATTLGARIERVEPTLADGDGRALPPAITLAAEVVRLLRAEPLLPPSLTPQPWPVDDLRARYRSFDRAIGRAINTVLRDDQSGAMRRPKRSSNLA